MPDHLSKTSEQQNYPKRCSVSQQELDSMSPVDLAEALERTLDSMTEENYDPDLIDAYLDTLDHKVPVHRKFDVEAAYSDFQQRLREMVPAEAQKAPEKQGRNTKGRRLKRNILVAAALIACFLGTLAVAQAAGIDVIGAIARWSEEVFSLGPIRYIDDDQTTNVDGNGDTTGMDSDMPVLEYQSMREALDAYGATDAAIPTWIPDGYVLDHIEILYVEDPLFLYVSADYQLGGSYLSISVANNGSGPNAQVEHLIDSQVDPIDLNGFSVYLVENNENYTVVWEMEQYEYCIGGAPGMDKGILLEMINSIP